MSTFKSLSHTPGPNDAGSMSSDDDQNPGEALSKLDLSHFSSADSGPQGDLGLHGSGQSALHAALASMSSGEALDYAISHIGGLDHLDAGHADASQGDAGHFDMPLDTSHDA